jgi:hypothetical protein
MGRPGQRRRAWTAAIIAGAMWLCSSQAAAEPHDTPAQKMREGAMYTDYVQLDFDVAEKKLNVAIGLCQAPTDCSHAVRAELFLDLGVVHFAQQRAEEGRAQFAKAIAENPSITLSKDFSTADLEKEFAAVKTKAGVAKNTVPLAGTTPAKPEATEETPTPSTEKPVKEKEKESDCPPGFPGCAVEPTACDTDAECLNGQKCVNFVCAGGEAADDTSSLPYKKNWVSVAFQEDFLVLPSATNACAGASGYTCFSSSGTYSGTAPPLNNADDIVNAGISPATMTILAGYDRSLTKNFEIGTRLGFILGGGPQRPGGSAFLPVHAEARVMYWFGKNPLARKGFRFFLVAAGGIGEIDGKVLVDDYANQADYKAGKSVDYNAWTKTGTGFAGAGGGMMYAILPFTGIVLEVKGKVLFPTVGGGLDAQLGYVFGF